MDAFADAENMLKEWHGETMFPYCKVLRLVGHEALAPINFPHLCKITNTRKRKIDGTFRDYRSTKESLSNLMDKEAEEAVMHPPMKKKTMSNRGIIGIKKVIPLSDEEIATGYSDFNKSQESRGSAIDAMIKSLNELIAHLPQSNK